MAKRTYIWFFLLVQFLTIVFISGQLQNSRAALPTIEKSISPFYACQIALELESSIEDEDNISIIKADELEYKENLNDLLLLRTTSYRFIIFEEALSIFFIHKFDFQIVDFCRRVFAKYQRVITLPEYYKFLHRFCPF